MNKNEKTDTKDKGWDMTSHIVVRSLVSGNVKEKSRKKDNLVEIRLSKRSMSEAKETVQQIEYDADLVICGITRSIDMRISKMRRSLEFKDSIKHSDIVNEGEYVVEIHIFR